MVKLRSRPWSDEVDQRRGPNLVLDEVVPQDLPSPLPARDRQLEQGALTSTGGSNLCLKPAAQSIVQAELGSVAGEQGLRWFGNRHSVEIDDHDISREDTIQNGVRPEQRNTLKRIQDERALSNRPHRSINQRSGLGADAVRRKETAP